MADNAAGQCAGAGAGKSAPARVAAGNRRDASAAKGAKGSAASHALLGAAHIRAADASCKNNGQ